MEIGFRPLLSLSTLNDALDRVGIRLAPRAGRDRSSSLGP